eukprot:Phypoly_transcript_01889.p1 GENE.Phypoly_transcript_01889~~Phypoly_transcript_01889.p1  ORF type:complete len:957 (+),score=170.97 Phypoly_transcript_01889:154-3024(+)
MDLDDAVRTLNELLPPTPAHTPHTPPLNPPTSLPASSPPPRPPASPPATAQETINNNANFEIDTPLTPQISSSPPSPSPTSPSSTSPPSPAFLLTPKTNPNATSIDETWKEFEENLEHILQRIGENKVEWTDNWGTMYRHIFTLKTLTREVLHRRQPLYSRFEELLVKNVDKQLSLLLNITEDAFLFLRTYLGKWCGFAIAIKYIHDIFGMHYFWVKNEQLPDIFMFGLNVWREHMFAKLKSHLSRALVTLLTLIRDNTGSLSTHQVRDLNFQFLPALIRNQIVMAPTVTEPLELFQVLFVQPYIECTSSYFHIESLKAIGDGNAPSISVFMIQAELRLEEEHKRLRYFESSNNADQDETFPDLYHALLHSCWYVCESMNTVEQSFTTALESLTDLVRSTLHEVLVVANCNAMISSCSSFFNEGKWEDLNRMLRLLTLTNSSLLLEQKMKDHVAEVGFTIVDKFDADPKKDVSVYVDEIFSMMTHYRNMVHTFPHHKFVQIIDKAFEAVLNRSKNGCRYLAQYVDCIIRASVKKSTDVHIEEALEKSADILNYIQDKDIFMVYYVHYLARRLLDTDIRSVDNDYEKQMIGKIKLNHGKSFTSKMEQMLRDVTLSEDISHNFNTFIRQEKGEANLPELIPTIMETGAWPSSVLRDPGGGGECFLPLEVDGAWFSFKAYYLSLYSGRRLVFTPHLGTAEVTIRTGSKEFSATVSTFAMCVLLLFEQTNSLTFSDILSMTNITPKALKFTLKSLTSPIPLPSKKGGKKVRGPPLLLTNEPPTHNSTNISASTTNSSTNATHYTNLATSTNSNSTVSKSSNSKTTNNSNTTTDQTTLNKEIDEFSDNANILFNANFAAKCPAKRFKITSSASSNSQTTTTSQMEDGQKKKREWQVDCIVVRVMKTRRRLQHNTLIQEVIAQSASHFIPTVALIKLRLQALIDREFIARDPADRTAYIYLE